MENFSKDYEVGDPGIDGLINALKVRGVYDASASELQRLFSEGENNTMIPVSNWMAFAEKQGMKGAIDLVDLAPFSTALMACYQAMEQVKNQIYELMGIADIQRGQTDPNDTLGAQIIKSNINVDLVIARFSRRTQTIMHFIFTVIGLVLFGLLSWRSLLQAIDYYARYRTIDVVGWPVWPFHALVVICAILLCCVFIMDLVNYAHQIKTREG